MHTGWTAIILAGQRPGPDKLASHFHMEWKALVPVAGEAMLTRVIRTLRASPSIGRIVVLSQRPDVMAEAVAAGGGADASIAGGSGIAISIRAIAGSGDAPWPVFVTTADHPLLTVDMIEQFLRDAAYADLSVGMVEERTMLARFPDARRTWLRFADGAWSGANLFALTGDAATPALDLWAEAEGDRKKPLKLFMHFGPMLALRAITRTIGLDAALARAGRRMGLRARLVALDDPVAAIDVDKPFDHAQAEAILAARESGRE